MYSAVKHAMAAALGLQCTYYMPHPDHVGPGTKTYCERQAHICQHETECRFVHMHAHVHRLRPREHCHEDVLRPLGMVYCAPDLVVALLEWKYCTAATSEQQQSWLGGHTHRDYTDILLDVYMCTRTGLLHICPEDHDLGEASDSPPGENEPHALAAAVWVDYSPTPAVLHARRKAITLRQDSARDNLLTCPLSHLCVQATQLMGLPFNLEHTHGGGPWFEPHIFSAKPKHHMHDYKQPRAPTTKRRNKSSVTGAGFIHLQTILTQEERHMLSLIPCGYDYFGVVRHLVDSVAHVRFLSAQPMVTSDSLALVPSSAWGSLADESTRTSIAVSLFIVLYYMYGRFANMFAAQVGQPLALCSPSSSASSSMSRSPALPSPSWTAEVSPSRARPYVQRTTNIMDLLAQDTSTSPGLAWPASTAVVPYTGPVVTHQGRPNMSAIKFETFCAACLLILCEGHGRAFIARDDAAVYLLGDDAANTIEEAHVGYLSNTQKRIIGVFDAGRHPGAFKTSIELQSEREWPAAYVLDAAIGPGENLIAKIQSGAVALPVPGQPM